MLKTQSEELSSCQAQVSAGKKYKEEGNAAFQAGDWNVAIKRYHTALIQVKDVGVSAQSLMAGMLGPVGAAATGSSPYDENKKERGRLLRPVVEEAEQVKMACYNNMAGMCRGIQITTCLGSSNFD